MKFTYKNWKGEVSERDVDESTARITFGSTEYHPVPQMLLSAWDRDKNAMRTFAVADIIHGQQTTGFTLDEELNGILSSMDLTGYDQNDGMYDYFVNQIRAWHKKQTVMRTFTLGEVMDILLRAQKASNMPTDDDVLISRNFIEQLLRENLEMRGKPDKDTEQWKKIEKWWLNLHVEEKSWLMGSRSLDQITDIDIEIWYHDYMAGIVSDDPPVFLQEVDGEMYWCTGSLRPGDEVIIDDPHSSRRKEHVTEVRDGNFYTRESGKDGFYLGYSVFYYKIVAKATEEDLQNAMAINISREIWKHHPDNR